MTLDTNDKIWKKKFTLPAGPYAYKAALDRSWTESYGVAVRDGQHRLRDRRHSDLLLRPATHWVTSDEEGPIVTVFGCLPERAGMQR